MQANIGSIVFPTSTYYPSGPSSVNQLVFTIPLTRPMNDTAYKSTVSMQQIYAQLSGQRFYLKLFLNSKQQSSFKIEITSTMMNLIQSLTLRWMVIASIWGNFYGYYQEQSFNTSISSSNPYTWTRNGLLPINVTGTVNIYSVLLGFDVTASTSIN